jgi:hypothetical protein
VAELIRKQPTPVRIPSREQTGAHGTVIAALGRQTVPPARRPTNRVAKLAGVATGAIVLLASVAAASILAGNRPAGPVEPRTDSPVPISGSPALRPDVLSAELGGGAPLEQHPEPHPEPQPAPQPAPSTTDVPPEPAVVPPPEPAAGPNPQVDVVRRFYELLPAKPADAARLLSSDLVGEDARDFVASWGRVQSITIESTTPQADGAVLAVVSMQERTGRWMHVEQVFRLTDTIVPRIVGTEVLSAQRS